ncbi:hypothetical protein GCM10010308_64830 [Streptomyces vinaceusdrappus]|nr:hypothetical protein GCM10010308_64830 [Streptomyces vinaceusdrappus]
MRGDTGGEDDCGVRGGMADQLHGDVAAECGLDGGLLGHGEGLRSEGKGGTPSVPAMTGQCSPCTVVRFEGEYFL